MVFYGTAGDEETFLVECAVNIVFMDFLLVKP